MVKTLTKTQFAEKLKERRGTPAESGKAKSDRKTITVTTHEYLVTAAAAELLAGDPEIFQRSGRLVWLTKEKAVDRNVTAKIELLPPAILRNRLTQMADWQRTKMIEGKPQSMPCHPPEWCIAAVHQQGRWKGVRPLEAVVSCPVLRRDGTVMTSPGYDPLTGLFGDFRENVYTIPDKPNRRDAIASVATLREILCDFPLQSPAHFSAWLAGLLTPLARFAFDGPAPMFMIEANTRGAGKGLLANLISLIVTGERFAVSTYSGEEQEMRKQITSLVLAGERMALLDNVDSRLGGAALESALTATIWKDRSLGANRMPDMPIFIIWYVTGNNCQISPDMARRCCFVRIETPSERPEERTDLKYPELALHVRKKRSKYLSAAMTILRAYTNAGKPEVAYTPWGSFEGWSALVRSSIIWAGEADPAETRGKATLFADKTTEENASLLALWERIDIDRSGMTAAELIRQCALPVESDLADELKALLEEMFNKVTPRALGFRLRNIRRRIFNGRFIDIVSDSHNVSKWSVFPASDF